GEHIEVIAERDAHRQQSLAIAIEGGERDEASLLEYGDAAQLARLKDLPPGKKPGRAEKRRRRGAAPEVPPLRLQRGQILSASYDPDLRHASVPEGRGLARSKSWSETGRPEARAVKRSDGCRCVSRPASMSENGQCARARERIVASMQETLPIDTTVLERARLSRDPRFDGKFFIAVTSTGIYCRPICPASPSPRRGNVRYFISAAAAAEAGFRPCLRCRPEAAPGTPAWLGTSAVVRRALRLINEGALDDVSVGEFATRVGVGTRHLDRLFLQHVGASPLAVAQTRRLHFAKRLIDESDLPMTQIALAAGFGSLRRFNDAFQKAYRRPPRELRRERREEPGRNAGDEVSLALSYRPPYDWNHLRDFLALRATPGVERVDEQGYGRLIRTDTGHAVIQVRPLPGKDALQLRVHGAPASALFQI